MALGLTSVTFRKLSAREVVSLATAAGCEIIEWGGDVHVTNPQQAREVHILCDDNGLDVHSFGSYYRLGEGNEKNFPTVCETASALGAKNIRVWSGVNSSTVTTHTELELLVSEMQRICDVASQYSLNVAPEFHKGTYTDTGDATERFLSLVDRKNLHTYWQPMYNGADVENLKEVINDICCVHMFYWSRLGVRYLLSKGDKRITEFADILRNNKYSGDVILEFVKGDKPDVFLNDFAFLKEKFSFASSGKE